VLLKHPKERKSKQETYYHPTLYLVRDRLNHKVVLSPWNNLRQRFRVHISKVKLLRRCPKEFFQDLDDEQRQKMGPIDEDSSDSSGTADSDYSEDQSDPDDHSNGPDDQGGPRQPGLSVPAVPSQPAGKSQRHHSPHLGTPNTQEQKQENPQSPELESTVTPMPTRSWRSSKSQRTLSGAARAMRSLQRLVGGLASSMRRGINPASGPSHQSRHLTQGSGVSQGGSIRRFLRRRSNKLSSSNQSNKTTEVNLSIAEKLSEHDERENQQPDAPSSSSSASTSQGEAPAAPVLRRSNRGNQRYDFAAYDKTGQKRPKN
jgi:hypothetical protein